MSSVAKAPERRSQTSHGLLEPRVPCLGAAGRRRDGSEAVVNVHVEADWHIVQRVSRNLVLRKGRAVACIVNKSFDPVGVRHASGTRTPEVERALVGAP